MKLLQVIAILLTFSFIFIRSYYFIVSFEPTIVIGLKPEGEGALDTAEKIKLGPLRILIYPEVDTNEVDTKRQEQEKLLSDAIDAFENKDYDNAAKFYVKISQYDNSALLWAGLAYKRAGWPDRARDYLLESLTHEDMFKARKALADLYYKSDDLPKTLEHIDKAMTFVDNANIRKFREKIKRELDSKAGFVTEMTQHFTVHFDSQEHSGVYPAIIGILESAYEEIGNELFFYPDTPVVVIVYTNREFHDVTQSPGWTGGIYDGRIKIPVKGITGKEKLLKRILFHEYTHAVVHRMARNCPSWINEGLAVHFSEPGMQITRGGPSLRQLENSFLRMRGDEVDKAYSASYVAVAHLIDNYGVLDIAYMLTMLGEGKTINKAFTDAFSFSYDLFVDSWGEG